AGDRRVAGWHARQPARARAVDDGQLRPQRHLDGGHLRERVRVPGRTLEVHQGPAGQHLLRTLRGGLEGPAAARPAGHHGLESAGCAAVDALRPVPEELPGALPLSAPGDGHRRGGPLRPAARDQKFIVTDSPSVVPRSYRLKYTRLSPRRWNSL